MRAFIKKYKYAIILMALVNFIMTPLWEATMLVPSSLIHVRNFTIVILVSFNAAEEKGPRIGIILIGLSAIVIAWLEYVYVLMIPIKMMRICFSLLLFSLLFYVLIRSVLKREKIKMDVIVGIMCGFLLIGIVGGVIYELLEFHQPGSLEFTTDTGTYGFYYFSFINMTSIGFGDIIPKTSLAQAVTVLLGILGQFYIAFGVAVFVGKYLNHSE